MTGETFGTIDAARKAGVTVRQLNHWAARGYLRPIAVSAPGHAGMKWQWDERDIDAAARFGALSAALGGEQGLLWTFARALAVPRATDDAVGVMMDVGRFRVTVEVRDV